MIDKLKPSVLCKIASISNIFDKILPLLFVISTLYNKKKAYGKGGNFMVHSENAPVWGCVVLAAGSGSRFGGDKLRADFRGQPLYKHALNTVPEGAAAVAVVSGDGIILAEAEERGYRAVENREPEAGVSRSIRLGLDALGECGGALFLVADQPLLQKETAQRVAEAALASPGKIAAPVRANGELGNPCFFPKEYFPALRALQGDKGGRRVISEHPDALVTVPCADEELADTDSREELIRLEADTAH